MSRGLLGDEVLSELAKELPDLAEMAETVLSLLPGFIPVHFPPESHVPVAAVCLNDAKCTVEEARYAFHEVLAHRKWYLEKREEPNDDAAVFFTPTTRPCAFIRPANTWLTPSSTCWRSRSRI